MNPSRDDTRRAPSFTLRCRREPPVTLERFGGQPIVLVLCSGSLEMSATSGVTGWNDDRTQTPEDDDGLAAVRAELRGLGAVLLLVFEDGALCVGPEDELWRIGPGCARDAAERAAMRVRYGVSPGATGLFVIDGDRRLRFSHIEVAPRRGTLHTIAGALAATGHIDVSRFTLSRRELVVSSLAAGIRARADRAARAGRHRTGGRAGRGSRRGRDHLADQRRAAPPASRSARDLARCPARAPGPDRHQEGLRPRTVRRLHRARRRPARERLPHARRDGGGSADHHDRGAGEGRRSYTRCRRPSSHTTGSSAGTARRGRS